jgi:long-chain acyl-CoA synthetase
MKQAKSFGADDHPPSLRALLEQRAAQRPEQPFLFSESDGRSYTYAHFDAAVNRAAQALAAHEITKGDVVSLLLPNSVEYVVAYFACWKLGALAGPVNSLLKASEMAYVMGHSEAKILLTNSEFLPAIEKVRTELPNLRRVIAFVVPPSGGSDAPAPPPEGGTTNADDEAVIIYTSGTTGKPKGCLLTHGNLLANARQIVAWLGYTERERLLTMMPLFHVNAIMVGTVAPLMAGGSVVVAPKFTASRFWQIVDKHKITTFGSVATMLALLNQTYPDGVPDGLDASSLRFALCGSAPVPLEVLQTFERTFKTLVVEGYGLSESTCRSTFNPPDERRRPGSCGLPIGNEMRVVDDDDQDVPDGELGEIVLRGPNILKGYFKNPAATAQSLRGGWFHTGDIGYRDADGFYYIVDRKSDMIIRGGENIYPREIDEVLYAHPAVAAAATIGVPHELYGEEVAAFVILNNGANVAAEEILDHCRARLADFKCPKTVHFVADIPKGPTGKLLKRELRRTLEK